MGASFSAIGWDACAVTQCVQVQNVVGGEGRQFFIVLASNGDWYINIVKVEDLARLIAGGAVFAIDKKIGGRVFWVGIVVRL